MADKATSAIGVEQIWVTVTEGAELTGYSRDHVQKLARENWKLSEDERLIKIRKHSSGYAIWLPDLMNYIAEHGLGPYQKLNSSKNV
jgi:hypothetical protein